MESAGLPNKIKIQDGSEMEFEEKDGVYHEVTHFLGDDAYGFYVPPHWHEMHDECITLLEGKLQVMLDGVWTTHEANPDVEITISRGIVHSFQSVPGTGPMKYRERTVLYGPIKDQPAFKTLFFRDLFQYGTPSLSHVCRVFSESDAYIKLPGPKFLSRAATYVGAGIGRLTGSQRQITSEQQLKGAATHAL